MTDENKSNIHFDPQLDTSFEKQIADALEKGGPDAAAQVAEEISHFVTAVTDETLDAKG